MYGYRFCRPSKPVVFAILMAASAICLMLPRDFFRPARQMTQLIALPQFAAQRAAQDATQPIQTLRQPTVSAKKHNEMMRRLQSLENENTALQQTTTQMDATIKELAGARALPGLAEEACLIPATVVAGDAAPGRASLVVGKGSRNKVTDGDWVTSSFEVTAGTEHGVTDNLFVLARQTLIGRVVQSLSHTSRVALLSDSVANKPMRVHIGQVDTDFVLQGIGNGQMRIAYINARWIENQSIRVGDLVTSDAREPQLPVSLVIGQITELHQDKKNPLLFDAIVQHRDDPQKLQQVLIVSMPTNEN